ncbi:uncharacterized protein LOC125289103 [Alosa alosa]|uniref:uncharacterized protein LOC125289103 n=1 Tax=Alosa alosa TaxID=278164 RepID=UPI00201538A8|nr:uncharacterized protein LOC125289103 [Alosa alosa]
MDRKAVDILFLYGICIALIHASRQYHYVADPKKWTEAQTYCREKHIDLATISDSEELQSFLHWSQNISVSAWIGLYHLYHSSSTTPETYNAIVGGQSQNHNQTHSHPFICYDERLNTTHGFISISPTKTWIEAQSYCREKHTDLATVKNAVEDEEIKKMAAANSYTWIGLHRVGWQWSDGSNFSSIFNLSETPTASASKCVVLNQTEWEALDCSVRRPFVCYGEVKKTVQFQRIRFQSDVNVNDAAVQEAILDQIKKKLQEHGLPADAKLSWRKQPDGQIDTLIHASRQYHYVADPKKWTEAQTYCREKHIDLATISDSEELQSFLHWSQSISVSAWIGLYHLYHSSSTTPETYNAIVGGQSQNHNQTHSHPLSAMMVRELFSISILF